MVNISNTKREDDISLDIAKPEELQNLHAQVEKLVTHHQPALKEIGALTEAERIVTWIEKCEEGSATAERKLYQKGLEMLESIKTRLNLAFEEQQRMEEESPAVASDTNARGREAERYAKASRSANAAVSTLTNLTDSTKH